MTPTPTGDETRTRILEHVEENPGVFKKALELDLGLGWGTIVYQVGLLVGRGELKLVKHRGHDRLFSVDLTAQEIGWICGLSANYGEQIVAVLDEDGYKQAYEIADALKVSRKVVRRTLNHLARASIVEKAGNRFAQYRLARGASRFRSRLRMGRRDSP